jgi:linoleoyl-CoA desaturase
MKTLKPTFQNNIEEPYYRDLKRTVARMVRKSDAKVKRQMHFKAGVLLLGFSITYALLLLDSNGLSQMLFYYGVLGFFLIIFFLNTAHDIAHNAFFHQRALNEKMLVVLDVLGDNSVIWKRRHVHYHHVFANVRDWDMDIRQSPAVRIYPQAPYRWFHRFQHLYMPMLYFFYTLHVSWYRDFYDLYGKNGLVNEANLKKEINHVRFYAYKLVNLTLFLFVPMLFIRQPAYMVFIGFVTMHMTGSIVAAIALISSHVGEDAVFIEAKENRIEHSWMQHQLITSTDFATANPVLTQMFGCFNHHVAHHLFPSVSHGHYPAITRLVKKLSARHDLGYKCISLSHAMITHLRLLKNNSNEESLFNE